MKHLIIYAHPNSTSLNHYLKQVIVNALEAKEHDIILRDLYELNFSPVLSLPDIQGQRMGQVAEDVAKEQQYIREADFISFIYPIWWTGMPAIMKGYIDRVFSYGFAYRYDNGVQKGLLQGKKAAVINTHGKSAAEYNAKGMDKALLLTSDEGVYRYCGLTVERHFFFDGADKAGSEVIANWQLQLEQFYSRPVL
ncbi:NAD(P)H-dependent oxidoreductase [Filimonas effusa]|uniref:Flavodoxin family protein n=1 Tax=Filimonas effusa TaxID=2508721 RepID=A0A4Q1D9N8_9BACT|nr:NAD(P)H-dependent oxidoreductase [Filimonas effusa]RXK86071.1 flavodoxin family protein [Filimonas effusa]